MEHSKLQQIAIVIPAYQPSQLLTQLVDDLGLLPFSRIVIVNDGSDVACNVIFEKCSQHPQVTVLTHPKNQGKGAALRTGMRWLLEHAQQPMIGVVTVDADGQHLPKDVQKVAEALLHKPDQLILGVRKFDKDVPLRSRFGNTLTRRLLHLRYRIYIQDTQTGLRGIPYDLMQDYLVITAQRYEYEMACLILAIKEKYPMQQVDIETVYLEKNASSHFNPVTDSMRIYYLFIRFALISFLSFAIDFLIFITLHYLLHSIFISLLVARFCSSSFNFFQNKYSVYRSHDSATLKQELIGYIAWSTFIFFISYAVIKLAVSFGMQVILAKVLVDACLFLVNFAIQKLVIFRATRK
jgi:glycosyltransferase involved in cell wall biosynthesis